MSLWIELHFAFEDAYRDPRNDDLIARIYSYADWCLSAPRREDVSHDPSTAVAVAFFEHPAIEGFTRGHAEVVQLC